MPPLFAAIPAIGAQLAAGAGIGTALGVGGSSALAALGTGAGLAGTLLPAASLGSSYLQGKSAERQAKKAQEQWEENAYPNEAAVKAAATENRGVLGQGRAASYQNLASNLAARGFGSGSGIGIGEGTNIEGNYLKGIGKMQTDLTKFRNTPNYPMPSAAYPTTSGWGAVAGTAGGFADKALGYAMMKNLYGGMKQPINNYYQSDPYGGMFNNNPWKLS
jgi:hypothetical protein